MKAKIYIETTVVSYLAARPARDIILLARQQLTSDFWDWSKNYYQLCTSPLTRQEAARGDQNVAARRLNFLNECSDLTYSSEAESLARNLIKLKAIPKSEPEDAVHIALATLAEVKYIATWNFSHMASPQAKRLLENGIRELGYESPLIATPEEIYESEAR
jgi:predicted nucleic acid-binding protein